MKLIEDFGFKINLKDCNAKRDGVTFDEDFLSNACYVYERMCTANYLRDCYNVRGLQKSWDLACEVRDKIADYNLSEEEAIEEVLNSDDF